MRRRETKRVGVQGPERSGRTVLLTEAGLAEVALAEALPYGGSQLSLGNHHVSVIITVRVPSS